MTKRMTIGLSLMAAAALLVCYLIFRPGEQTIDNYLLAREGTEYTGVLYQIPDTAVAIDGNTLDLHHIYFLKDDEELQFGFSVPTPAGTDTEKPFEVHLESAAQKLLSSGEVLFATESKDGTTYYRAFLTSVSLDLNETMEIVLVFSDGERELGMVSLLPNAQGMSEIIPSEVNQAVVQ